MVPVNTLQMTALSFPEVTQEPHFHKTSFRIKKKIFATWDSKTNLASLKLSPIDQDVFSLSQPEAIYAVPNKWGTQGWTLIDMSRVSEKIFLEALRKAYGEVAPKKLADQVLL